jgi:hypothetical protein
LLHCPVSKKEGGRREERRGGKGGKKGGEEGKEGGEEVERTGEKGERRGGEGGKFTFGLRLLHFPVSCSGMMRVEYWTTQDKVTTSQYAMRVEYWTTRDKLSKQGFEKSVRSIYLVLRKL